jgi:hypothetical protein
MGQLDRLKGRDHLKDISVGGRPVLKRFSGKKGWGCGLDLNMKLITHAILNKISIVPLVTGRISSDASYLLCDKK